MAGSPMTNLRDMTVNPGMAKDVKDTEQLKPNAHKTAAENSKNETKQYETQGINKGPGHDGAENAGV